MGLILLLIVIAVVIFFFVKISRDKETSGSHKETPLDVLRTRYAKGEISKGEFDRMKEDL
ncbi:MAG: SHOCT domain-containing protein [Deltaproteobacteria bacterium]|nr:SHOCT domain-containing protein [Deltaproteobacteria bacterium]